MEKLQNRYIRWRQLQRLSTSGPIPTYLAARENYDCKITQYLTIASLPHNVSITVVIIIIVVINIIIIIIIIPL